MSKAKHVALTGSKENSYLIKIDDPVTGLLSLTTVTHDELKALW